MSETASTSSRPTSPTPTLPHVTTSRPYRFQWDPASRRPGPGSVISEATEGRGDNWGTPSPGAGFYNQNFSSTSLTLGALPQEWSSAKHGFHGEFPMLSQVIMGTDRD